MENFIDQLNEAQKAPVLHKDGPLMVIAGAGSGKT
ncbi:MAG: UvrD-helicase domain-containing protein, partial [Pricia sp.]